MGGAYYNEFDAYAAQWLRNLIAAGLVAPGDVDDRSIVDVRPDDLAGYTQAHFFAGIGGWSHALRLAGWADDRPVWTGSCPCQPFSAAGKRKGTADARHLWPVWFDLIRECRPPVVFGEQVSSAEVVGTELEASFVIAVREGRFADANRIAKRLAASKALHFHRRWIDGVSTDMEGQGYAFRHEVLGAHSVGAPHIRQRLWWVADAVRDGAGHGSADGHRSQGAALGIHGDPSWAGIEPRGGGAPRRLADADGGLSGDGGLQPGWQHGQQPQDGGAGGMGDADSAPQERLGRLGLSVEPEQEAGRSGHADAWAHCEPLGCSDGKTRRVEPSVFPLAHGVPNRVGRLRAYGNAIVPALAAEFIAAFQEAA